MRKTTLIAVLCGLLFPCSKTAFTFAPSPLPEAPPNAAGTPAPGFTLCKGTFALCTSAKCTGQRTQTGLKVKCSCEVMPDAYSVGTKPCSDVPQALPTQGQVIPSRYSPITSTAVCPGNGVWAFCLDKKCTVDHKTSKATCECTLLRSPQKYVVVAGTATDAMCTSAIWSSATVDQVLQVTAFLFEQNSPNLLAQPITIVRVEGKKK
jgi:hypothetical protein